MTTTSTTYWTRRDVDAAAERLKGARNRVSTARRELQDAVRSARAHTDADLSDDGLETRRRQLIEQARARIMPRIEQVQSQVRADLDTLDRWDRQHRPALDADAGGAQRAALVWEGVRGRLDAGMSPASILAGADLQTALVVEQYAPAWIEAKHHAAAAGQPVEPVDLTGFRAAVRTRLEQVATGDAQHALKVSREAHVATAGLDPIAQDAATLGTNTERAGSGLEAAIQARLAVAEAEAAGTLAEDGADHG